MVAAKHNFIIEQGTTWQQTLDVTDDNNAVTDLTGYTAKMDVKASLTDSSSLLSLNTATSQYLSITPALGRLSISVPNTVTSALSFDTAVYDLELTYNGSVVTRLLEGSVILSKEVTR